MRFLPVLIGCLALVLNARGQGSEVESTPAPTPAQPADAPPLFQFSTVAVVAARPFVFRVTNATSPAQFKVLISQATAAEILSMATSPAMGAQAFIILLQNADAATQQKVIAALATAPEAMQALVGKANGAELIASLLNVATGADGLALATALAANPDQFVAVLDKATVRTRMAMMATVATRAATMSLDQVKTADLDLLTATLRFAVQDPRYRDIDHMSYFGVKLSKLNAKVAAEGLTAENKAAILQVYSDATSSLQVFLANEQRP